MSLCRVTLAKDLSQRFLSHSDEALLTLVHDDNGSVFVESVIAPRLMSRGVRPGDHVAYLDGGALVGTNAAAAQRRIDKIWNSPWRSSLDMVFYRHYTRPFSFDGVLVPRPRGVRFFFRPSWVSNRLVCFA